MKQFFTLIISLGLSIIVSAQSPLERRISITANQAPLERVLQAISTKGNFYFAYNSSILKPDSLVTLNMLNKSVRDVLLVLFQSNYEYKTAGNYVILRRAPYVLRVVSKTTIEDKIVFISGYVLDDRTGFRVKDASVYDKVQLVSSISDGSGYFKLRLKSKYSNAALTVSKVDYLDTTVMLEPKFSQVINIPLVPIDRPDQIITISPDPAIIAPDTIPLEIRGNRIDSTQSSEFSKVEETSLGKFFSNSLQRVQSLNLGNYIAQRPYQVSIVPGLSTHGKLSANVVNNVSLNIFGGYTAGVNGVEVGGLFNMNKRDMHGAQVGGLANIIGGNVDGAQVGGLYNLVLGDVSGIQVGGISNTVRGNVRAIQIGGIYSHAGRSMHGTQIGGVANFTGRTLTGIQIAGVFNYAKKLQGVQIGLINVSDTSDGFSIGLINIVMKGYHKFTVSTNDALQFNAAFKTGNTNLYSILMGGVNTGQGKRQVAMGYGIGTERRLGRIPSINPELSCQQIYQGSWDYANLLSKFNLDFHLHFGKYISIYGGPSLNIYYSRQTTAPTGFKTGLADGTHKFTIKGLNDVTGWFGWNVGIAIF